MKHAIHLTAGDELKITIEGSDKVTWIKTFSGDSRVIADYERRLGNVEQAIRQIRAPGVIGRLPTS